MWLVLTENRHWGEFCASRKRKKIRNLLRASKHAARSHNRASTQPPFKKKKKKVQWAQAKLPRAPPKLFSVCKWKMCLGTARASRQSRNPPCAQTFIAALWTSLAPLPTTAGQNSCCVLTLSLPHPLLLSHSAIICEAPTQTCKNRPSQSTDKPSHSVLKPWHHDHLTSAWNSSLI